MWSHDVIDGESSQGALALLWQSVPYDGYTAPMSKRSTSNETQAVEVEAYVFDTLMHDLIGHDRAASAFVVYLHLWRRSFGAGDSNVQTSLRDIAEGTGLSKRGVQEALTVLSRRQLVGIARKTLTD